MTNPIGDFAWVRKMNARADNLESDVRDLQSARGTYAQTATVSTFVSGPFCTVTFESGDTAVLARISTYATPVVGDSVVVLISPFMSVILGKLA